MNKFICSLCGKECFGYGNNPYPLKSYEERCCNKCNYRKVVPARVEEMFENA